MQNPATLYPPVTYRKSFTSRHFETYSYKVKVFPNVHITLRIYLTLPTVTNTTKGERSFSVLKRVKNQLFFFQIIDFEKES